MDNFESFFAWCDRYNLKDDASIAKAFGWKSPQTIKNWRIGNSRPRGLPKFVPLQCIYHDASGKIVSPTQMDLDAFKRWMSDAGLSSTIEVAKIFGVTRQSVYGWMRDNTFPLWLSNACKGHLISISAK